MALNRPYPRSRRSVLSEVGFLCTFVDAAARLRQHLRGYVETNYSLLGRWLQADLAADPRRKATGVHRLVRVFSHHIQVDSPQPVFVAFGRPETRHGGPPEKLLEARGCLVADRDSEHLGPPDVYQLPIDTQSATCY